MRPPRASGDVRLCDGAVMQKSSLDRARPRATQDRPSGPRAGGAPAPAFGGHERVLRQTVIAMAAGRRLEEHENPGEATVYVLSGRVRLSAGDVDWEGSPGDLLTVPEARHALLAVEDYAVLLTVAKLAVTGDVHRYAMQRLSTDRLGPRPTDRRDGDARCMRVDPVARVARPRRHRPLEAAARSCRWRAVAARAQAAVEVRSVRGLSDRHGRGDRALVATLRATRVARHDRRQHWGFALPPADDRPHDSPSRRRARRDIPDDVSACAIERLPAHDSSTETLTITRSHRRRLPARPVLRVALSVGDSALRAGHGRLAGSCDARRALRGPRQSRSHGPGSRLLDARAANAFESCARAILIDAGITGFEPQVSIRHAASGSAASTSPTGICASSSSATASSSTGRSRR